MGENWSILLKKFTILVASAFFIAGTLVTSVSPALAETNYVEQNLGDVEVVTIGNETVEVEYLEKNTDGAVINVRGDEVNDIITLDYATQEFVVTDETGHKEEYLVKDFIIDETPNIVNRTETDEEIAKALEESGIPMDENFGNGIIDESNETSFISTGSNELYNIQNVTAGYITNLNQKLNVTGTIKWNLSASYVRGGKNVYAYSSSHLEPNRVAPKKFSFTAGTAVSVVIGALVGWATGSGIGIAILGSLGATIIDMKLKYLWSPTLYVKRYNNLRAFYCGSGYVITTKSWSDYVVNSNTGKSEKYRSDSYNAWYNNKETWKLADVAYQQYRLVIGARSTYPHASEFYWN